MAAESIFPIPVVLAAPGGAPVDLPSATVLALVPTARPVGGGSPGGTATRSVRQRRRGSVALCSAANLVPADADASSPTPDPAFTFTIARAVGMVVVTAHGHLDAVNGALLEDVLADLIAGQGNLRVIVDLSDVAAVDPSSLDGLAAAAALAAARGGELQFADPCDAVLASLEGVGLAGAVAVTAIRRLRSLSPPPPRSRTDRELRRAMANHPAGADGNPNHPWGGVSAPPPIQVPGLPFGPPF